MCLTLTGDWGHYLLSNFATAQWLKIVHFDQHVPTLNRSHVLNGIEIITYLRIQQNRSYSPHNS